MKYILPLLMLLSLELRAQTDLHTYARNNNTWVSYTGSHKIAPKWGVHLETQIRRSDFVKDWQQLFFRVGLNYHVNKDVTVSSGYAYAETWPYGDFPAKAKFPEHRIWQGLQLKNMQGPLELNFRLRQEQRFVHAPTLIATGTYKAGKAVYTNRSRLMIKAAFPISKKSITDHTLYAVASNEIFVNFGTHVANNIFDQNRAFLGLGYKVPKFGRIETGYLLQSIQKSDGLKVEQNNTFVLALIGNFDLYKKKQ